MSRKLLTFLARTFVHEDEWLPVNVAAKSVCDFPLAVRAVIEHAQPMLESDDPAIRRDGLTILQELHDATTDAESDVATLWTIYKRIKVEKREIEGTETVQ